MTSGQSLPLILVHNSSSSTPLFTASLLVFLHRVGRVGEAMFDTADASFSPITANTANVHTLSLIHPVSPLVALRWLFHGCFRGYGGLTLLLLYIFFACCVWLGSCAFFLVIEALPAPFDPAVPAFNSFIVVWCVLLFCTSIINIISYAFTPRKY